MKFPHSTTEVTSEKEIHPWELCIANDGYTSYLPLHVLCLVCIYFPEQASDPANQMRQNVPSQWVDV